LVLAQLISEYGRVRERMNTDDGNLIWPLSNCTSPYRLREYETKGIKSGLWAGGGGVCVCVCVCEESCNECVDWRVWGKEY
jgi:hypothetical protein